MIIGETLMSSATVRYSNWFPARANSALVAGEVVDLATSAKLLVDVETKKLEETDAQAVSVGGGNATSKGVFTISVAGCKELVRFTYEVNLGDWVHFRMLPTLWRPN